VRLSAAPPEAGYGVELRIGEVWRETSSLSSPTPNPWPPEKAGVGLPGVSLGAERGTTQTGVKAPKCRLSANQRASRALDSGEVGLTAAIL